MKLDKEQNQKTLKIEKKKRGLEVVNTVLGVL